MTKETANKFGFDKALERIKGIAPDNEQMHEPDNDGIEAKVTGTHLDNAMGGDPFHNCCEFTVGITKDGIAEWHNLATIIALAKLAKFD